MALVNVVNMVVLDNPTAFGNPFQFEITFECLQQLEDDLEWKVVYVGSAEDSACDQVLDEILVGPVPVGVNKFVLQADPPESDKIDAKDILGVTVVLVTCSYREKEFIRVGYYVNNEYSDEYDAEKGPPEPLDMNKVVRTILADKPRVTRFPVNWTSNPEDEAEKEEGGGGQDQQQDSSSTKEDGSAAVAAEEDGAAQHQEGDAMMTDE